MTAGDRYQHSSSTCSRKKRDRRGNDMDVDDVMRSQGWVKATSAISTTTSSGIPARAWRTPLARHLKLASFLQGGDGNNNNNNNNNNNRANREDEDDDGDDSLLDEQAATHHHPLHVAASQNILKLGSLLLAPASAASASVDPSVRDGSGRTPLHWAAMTGRADFALLLLESGAKLDAVDREHRTPLLSSSAFGATDSVRLLLEWGADCRKASRGGLTPLHAAAAGGHAEAAELLIGGGASVHARTDMGCNPRHVAERQGHIDIVRMLSACARRSRSRSLSSASAETTMVGGNGLWRGGGGGGGGGGYGGCGDRDAYEEERREVCKRHSFDRADLLGRPLFR